MVEVARKRLPGAEFQVADMRSLTLPPEKEGSFDLCISLFDSIGYAVTNEGVIAAMKTARRVLKTGGVFAFEVWHAAKFLRSASTSRKLAFIDAKGRRIVRLSETKTDAARMCAEVDFTFFVEEEGGFSLSEECHVNRFFGVPEIDLLLAAAGWNAPARHFGGFSETRVDGDSWHILTLVEKT
jgi:SAM-dependent methyltransferase